MEHGLGAGMAQRLEVCVEADRRQRGNHQEFADGLHDGGDLGGQEVQACQCGHGEEAQDEPREDRVHIDVYGGIFVRGGFLFLFLYSAKVSTLLFHLSSLSLIILQYHDAFYIKQIPTLPLPQVPQHLRLQVMPPNGFHLL